jgi:hypothetical protein
VVAIIAVAGWMLASPRPSGRSAGQDKALLLHLPLDSTAADRGPLAVRTTTRGLQPAADRHGKSNGACRFGPGSCIEVLEPAHFSKLPAWTISAWVKPSDLGEGVCFLANWPEGRDFAMNISNRGQLIGFFAGGERNLAFTEEGLIRPGVWTFISAAHQAGKWHFFINGQRVPARPEPSFPSSGADKEHTAPTLTIGAFYPGAPGGFLGDMDDVRIHARALGELELAALMNS